MKAFAADSIQTVYVTCKLPSESLCANRYYVLGVPVSSSTALFEKKMKEAIKLMDTTNIIKFPFSAVCSPTCMNGGECVRPNECNCAAGYYGAACDKGRLNS